MYIILAGVISLIVTLIAGKLLIPALVKLKAGQSIKEIGPTWHMTKQGTPTMGGLMFIIGIGVAILAAGWPEMLEGRFTHLYVYAFALVFGVIGYIDDYQKVKHHQNTGLTAPQKFILQLAAAVAFLCLMRYEGMLSPNLYIPFFNTHIVMNWVVYMIFAAFVIVGTVNAVNITDGLERYMVVRALAAVERSRVALILVDATVGFTEQDSKVAGYAHDQGKACIIVVNKWDAVEGKETNTMELQRKGYAECFSFMGYAPIIFISAQTGYNVNKLMQLIRDVDAQNGARVPTGVLNEMLARATARMQPPSDKGRRLKIFYLTQASTRPPTFVAFVNAKHLFHFSYQRYIINQIRENFGLEHTPIRLVVRERGSGEVGAKDV